MKFDFRIILILSLLLQITIDLPAQNSQEVSPENQLIFYTDMAGFRDFKNNALTYQEIYISLPNYQLSYVKQSGFYLAAYQVSIVINDATENQIAQKEWESLHQIDYLKESENLTSLEIAGFLIAPGEYSVSIKIKDLNSDIIGLVTIKLPVLTFEPNKLHISEIQFARSIKASETRNKFFKNNIEILPNPSRVFGIESPFLYFYAEIYNLNQPEDEPGKLKREFSITDGKGKIIKSAEKIIQPKSASSIWAEKVNLLDVLSGKYVLKLTVIDELNGTIAEREAEFWINNPYKVISLAQYDEEELNEFRAQIEYIVESTELEFFDQLNTKGKIQYINDFWRDKSPEYRIEHLKRFYSAQERFVSPTLPGWKSDRGRIYIMYGPPDEIVREPASIDTKAYEIWIYESMENQGRVEFVFVDLGVVGNYRLVHSTLKSGERVEIYNPDWMNDIKIAR